MKGVQSVVVDTTARSFVQSVLKPAVLRARLAEALSDDYEILDFGSSKLHPTAIYELEVEGFS